MTHRNLFEKSRVLSIPARLGLVLALLAALGVQPAPVARAATYDVDRTDDNAGATACTAAPNDCSLRGAITAANASPGADTISLGPYTYNLTTTGFDEDNNATGDLDILAAGGDLTISGAGAGSTIINGPGIDPNADRVLHIDPTGTGGITVNISDVTIQNGNRWTSPPYGGGIYAGGDNTVNITNCVITGNRASIVGSGGRGGGIYSYLSTVNVTASTISQNQVTVGAGDAAHGGGVYANWGTVNVTDSTISNNTVNTGGGAGSMADGGGIYSWYSTVNVTNSAISGNQTTSGGSFYGRGGGIYTAYSTVSIADGSTLSDNQADDDGGGIYCDSGTVTIGSSTIGGVGAGNQASLGGGVYNDGGTVILDGSIVSDNTADYGGGINNSGTLTVTHSTVGVVGGSNQAAFNGGGIYNAGATTVDGSTIWANVATGYGGGICNWTTLTVTNSTFGGNNQALSGGGIYNWGAATINDSTIRDNTATNRGGGICNTVGGAATVNGCTVSGNTADDGGGIYNLETLNVQNGSTIGGNNQATDDGGGIYNDHGDVTLDHSTVSDNTSGLNGSGIYSTGSGGGATLTLEGCTISGNDANGIGSRGGGIYLYYSSVALTNTTVSGNTATTDGGGIGTLSDESRTIDLVHCTVYSNTAGGNGGGMQLEATFTVNVRNTIVASNGAAGSGPDIDGEINSQDYNLIQDTTDATINGTTTHNITGQNPHLAPLTDNGGRTQTHALLATSPALDAIPVISCTVSTDQRGRPRPFDGDFDGAARCDVGACEHGFTIYLPLVLRN